MRRINRYGEKMKKLIITTVMLIGITFPLSAEIRVMDKEEMIKEADLIAIVQIQELISSDKSREMVDLTANGSISEVLKGNEQRNTSFSFKIPRFFPCGAFDVSTGTHLVFLKKKDNSYGGFNWYMSYIYLHAKEIKWFDEKITDPEKIMREVKDIINKTITTKSSGPSSGSNEPLPGR